MTLQEVPDRKWRERYSEGQKLRARIIYVDANSKKVSALCGGPQDRVHTALRLWQAVCGVTRCSPA